MSTPDKTTLQLELPARVSVRSIVLTQPPDCDQPTIGPEQLLKIDLVNNGAAHFVRLKTNGWAIDGKEDLEMLGRALDDLQRQADEAFEAECKKPHE